MRTLLTALTTVLVLGCGDSSSNSNVGPQAETAWALGVLDTDPEVVLGSTDGGRTWEALTAFERRMGLRAIGFSDAKRGWVVGSTFLATEDGGLSWENREALLGEEGVFLSSVFFVDSSTGVVAGSQTGPDAPPSSLGRPFVATTSNAGRSWDIAQVAFEGEALLKDACITRSGVGVAVGATQREVLITLATNDFGRNWTDISAQVAGSSGVDCAGESQLWILGNSVGATNIFRSSDGLLWTNVGSLLPSPVSFGAWDFIGEDRGSVTGLDSDGFPRIFATDDGGSTWGEQPTPLPLGSPLRALPRPPLLS